MTERSDRRIIEYLIMTINFKILENDWLLAAMMWASTKDSARVVPHLSSINFSSVLENIYSVVILLG